MRNINNNEFETLYPMPSARPESDNPTEDASIRLRKAQNLRRGRPKKGSPKKVHLSQVNIKCDSESKRLFERISRKAGRTKRDLFCEALNVLKARYKI